MVRSLAEVVAVVAAKKVRDKLEIHGGRFERAHRLVAGRLAAGAESDVSVAVVVAFVELTENYRCTEKKSCWRYPSQLSVRLLTSQKWAKR